MVDLRRSSASEARLHGRAVRASGADALAALAEHDVDVVVTDLNMQGMTGLELCQRIVADRPDVPVIVITAFGSLETAVAAIRAGAYDFVTKPVEIEALAIAVRRAVEHRALRDEVKRLREVVARTRGRGDLIGASPAMQQVYELIDRVAATDATVLITGESGTGKELVARALHERSRRADGPVRRDQLRGDAARRCSRASCSATRKGAFTDAQAARAGPVRAGERRHAVPRRDRRDAARRCRRSCCARCRSARCARSAATTRSPFDARIVAATNRDLEAEVEEKRFREDLYYRINVVHIDVPPLRARGGDVLLLAQHFAASATRRVPARRSSASRPPAAERLLAYDWPGNVRELENCIERAVALARFEEITVDDLPEKIRDVARPAHVARRGDDRPSWCTLEEVERRYILRVLEACGGNRTDAAKILGLDRKTLYRKLLRWGVGE